MIDTLKKNGVSIDGKHSFFDYGLIMTEKTISAPEAQINKVAIPGRNGSVDFSEVLTGNVRYNDRTISMSFYTDKKPLEWSSFVSEIRNRFQGNKVRIIFDDDIAFYWLGRCNVEFANDGKRATVSITAKVEPYKYNITTSAEDWLWDPFDFDNSIINEFGNILVDTTYTAKLVCTGKVQTPIISVSEPMFAMLDDNTTVQLDAGQNVVYEFVLDAGEHEITLIGNGTASINYVGGSL